MIQGSNSFVRGEWKMGLVSKVIPSDDGMVRRVEVSYKNIEDGREYKGKPYTIIERPVQRLVVLLPAEERSGIDTQ